MLKIEISYRGMVAIGLALVTAWALIQLWPVLLLVAVALILMIGLLPYVDALVDRGLPRSASVILLLLAILLTIVGLFTMMIPPLVDQITAAKEDLPASAREIEELLASIGIDVELQQRARDIDWQSLISGRAAFDYGQRVASVTLSILTIIVITTYLLIDTPRLSRFVHQFIPADRKAEADRLFRAMSRVVGGYLRGQFITSLAIGAFTFVVLTIVGGPNPAAFAVLAAFADVIPLVGGFIAIFPPVAAILPISSTKAVAVLIALVVYQQFEDRYLVPRVYGSTLNLPPIIVLFAVLSGAELMGITGVLLALPLAAAGRVALDYALEKRGLAQESSSLAEADSGDELFAPDRKQTQDESANGESVERETVSADGPARV